MALEKWGGAILHSLYGRKFGVDDAGFPVGGPGTRHPYEAITSASTLANSGISVLTCTAASSHTLTDPDRIGLEKTIVNNSTYAQTITRVAAEIYGSTGTSPLGVKMSLLLPGSCVTLVSVSTSRWIKKDDSFGASTAFLTVSTSS